MKPEPHIRWESANDFIERQTKNMEREFCTSRPKPTNKRMGFNGMMTKAECDLFEPKPL